MKSWHPVISQHIQDWSRRLGSLNWWPKFVYHFTDVQNAVSILERGFLCSREEANRLGLMHVDNASPSIIQQTHLEHLRFVRLYFRPRTPTQYRNEGIRPLGQRELGGAHCPVPVFCCFDAFSVLSMDETEFSDGNMGSPKAHHSGDQSFFRSIPFNLVYHNGAIYPDEDRDEIVFRRHAEVLVPDRLLLEQALRVIYCRTSAERQTLLYLLPDAARQKWENRIRLGDLGFYDRKWTFVEEVVTVDDKIIFRFNPNTLTPGPFDVRFTYLEDGEEKFRIWSGKVEKLDATLQFRIPDATYGLATLYLDDSLAFKGRMIFSEIPF